MFKRGKFLVKNGFVFSQISSIILALISIAFLIGQISSGSAQQQTPISNMIIATGSTSFQGFGTLPKALTVNGVAFQPGPLSYLSREGNLILTQGTQTVTVTGPELQTALQEANINLIPQGATPGANGVEQGIVSDIYSGKIFGATPGTIPSALIQGVAWGLTAFIALKMITGLLGVDDNTANAISAAGGAGFTDY